MTSTQSGRGVVCRLILAPLDPADLVFDSGASCLAGGSVWRGGNGSTMAVPFGLSSRGGVGTGCAASCNDATFT